MLIQKRHTPIVTPLSVLEVLAEAKNSFIAGEENTLVVEESGADFSGVFLFLSGKEGGVLTHWNRLLRDSATLLGTGVLHTLPLV